MITSPYIQQIPSRRPWCGFLSYCTSGNYQYGLKPHLQHHKQAILLRQIGNGLCGFILQYKTNCRIFRYAFFHSFVNLFYSLMRNILKIFNSCNTRYFEYFKIYHKSCFLRNKIFILSSCIVLSIFLWYSRSRSRLQLGKYQWQEIDPGFSFSCWEILRMPMRRAYVTLLWKEHVRHLSE